MGWTGLYSYDAPSSYKEEKAFITKQWTYTSNDITSEVLAVSKVGSVWYLAIRVTGDDTPRGYTIDKNGSYVYGHVLMTSRRND